MEVTLLTYTPEPDETAAAAARICYSDLTGAELLAREEAKLSETLIEKLRLSGHLSTFEHVSFTFAIDGISRVASHQLVRHRIASFSQQSQRYVKMNEPAAVVIPPSVSGNPEAESLFCAQAEAAYSTYKKLTEMGIPAEDARFLLPHGWETHLVMTMNARELLHFFNLRLCRRAQWEIRELARRMLILCREAAPVLFRTAGPSCAVLGKCGEAHPCGMPYSSTEELLKG